MDDRKNKLLVLGLGNDILGDDAIGLVALREIKKRFPRNVDFVEAAISGFEIMEILEGYGSVLLLDAVVTKANRPGTIMELSREQFEKVVAISPHYMGLPEIFRYAETMKMNFPKKIRILAVEIEPPYEIKEGLSEPVRIAVPAYLDKAEEIITELLG